MDWPSIEIDCLGSHDCSRPCGVLAESFEQISLLPEMQLQFISQVFPIQPKSGTACITANSEEVARCSCSSWPRIPATEIRRAGRQPSRLSPSLESATTIRLTYRIET